MSISLGISFKFLANQYHTHATIVSHVRDGSFIVIEKLSYLQGLKTCNPLNNYLNKCVVINFVYIV